MTAIGVWLAVTALVIGGALLFYFRSREKSRKNMFVVLRKLAAEELEAPLPRLSVEAVQQRYEHLKSSVEQLFKLARKNHEFAQCKSFEKGLGEWRVRKIQEIYQQRLDRLLEQVRKERNSQKRLDLLYQARELAKEGILDNQLLNKIEKWIVYTHIRQVRNREVGLSLEMKYQLYEEAITKILNSGIEDEKLEAMDDFKEFITDFEIMYRRLKKSERKPE